MRYARVGRSIQLGIDGVTLDGRLALPTDPTGLVLFVNGQWGVRYATRETELAEALYDQGFATLLMELFTPEEATERSNRFMTDILAGRLAGVCEWAQRDERTAELARLVFGVGPGAATGLQTAARPEADVRAVVSLNGRLDLIADTDDAVTVPTLLLVDSDDDHLLHISQDAYGWLGDDRQHVVLQTDRDAAGPPVAEIVSLANTWFRTHANAT